MELYALHKNYAVSYLEAIENASLEERAAAHDRFSDQALPDIVTHIEGTTEAVITIAGPLSPNGPSFIARFFGFGGTAYNDIILAAQQLENDPTIETVRLAMDTPGGTTAGMDQARQALESLAGEKTVIAENHGMIASAGYYIAMAAESIEAMSPIAKTGSIGVIMAGLDFTDAMARNGVKRIKIISKNAPNKQADPTTPHGLSVLQDEIDAMERVFIQVVAEGRNTTEQDVIENFGKGGMLIAQDPDSEKPSAIKSGMIDKVSGQIDTPLAIDDDDEQDDGILDNEDATNGDSDIPKTEAAEGGQQKGTIMDLAKLKAEHPALFAEAVEVGVKQERERVDAHLTMGKASGDMEFAVSCITDGSELTASTNAKYMAASMDKGATATRATESEDDLETEATETDDNEDELAKATADALGVEIDG